jgi:HTH-type transcriptional regulator / antitoxin HipB
VTRTLADARHERENTPEVTEAYAAARLRYELGTVVRERREELGWSQTELARRTGMRQPAIARFEAGGTVPTLPLLERLANALGLQLTVKMAPDAETTADHGIPEERHRGPAKRRKSKMASA